MAEDRVLDYGDIHDIAEVLSKDDLISRQDWLPGALGITSADTEEIKRRVNGGSSYTFFDAVIRKWMAVNSTESTLEKLVNALRKGEYNSAADKILKIPQNPEKFRKILGNTGRQTSFNNEHTDDSQILHRWNSSTRRPSEVPISCHQQAATLLHEGNLEGALVAMKLSDNERDCAHKLTSEVDGSRQEDSKLNNLIDCLARLGKFDDIHKICVQYLDCHDKSPHNESESLEIKYQIGMALLSLKRIEEATKMFQRILMTQTQERINNNNQSSPINATLTYKTKIAFAFSLSEQGRNSEAYDNLREPLATLNRENPDGPLTLKANMYQSIITARLGEDMAGALDIGEKVLNAQVRLLGRDHKSTMETTYHLATIHQDMKNYAEAFRLLSYVKKVRDTEYGPDHPDTIEVEHRIAETYSAQGKNKQANEILAKLRKRAETVLGDSHKTVYKIKRCYAQSSSRLGSFEDALTMYDGVHTQQEMCFGIEHASTLETKYQMGITLMNMKKFQEALKILTEVDQAQYRELGKDHHSRWRTQSDIAAVEIQRGNYHKSKKILENLIPMQTAKLGSDHTETLRSRRYFAEALARLGDLDKAEAILLEIRPPQEWNLGIHHPSVLETGYQLGITYKLGKKFDAALMEQQQVHNIQSTSLGENHPLSLVTKLEIGILHSEKGDQTKAHKILYNIIQKYAAEQIELPKIDFLTARVYYGQVLSRQGHCKDALKEFNETLPEQEDILGIEHPSTLETKYQIGITLAEIQDHHQALKILLEVQGVRIRVFGDAHPATLQNKTDLAREYSEIGRNNDALEKFKEIQLIRDKQNNSIGNEQKQAKVDVDTLRTWRYHARTHSRLGNFSTALEILDKVVRSQEQLIGAEHPSLLETMYQIGTTLKDWGKLDQAHNKWIEVLRIRDKVLGTKHPKTLQTQISIVGLSLESAETLRSHDETLRRLDELIKAAQETLGPKNQDTLRVKRYKAQALSNFEMYKDAVDLFQKVRTTQEEEFGVEHPITLETIFQIGICQARIGRHVEALDSFQFVLNIRERILPGHRSTIEARAYVDQLKPKQKKKKEGLLSKAEGFFGKKK